MFKRLLKLLSGTGGKSPTHEGKHAGDKPQEVDRVKGLLGMLKKGKGNQRGDAALRLGAMGARDAIPELIAATERKLGPRCQATRALGMMGDTSVIPVLERLLLDSETHESACLSLLDLGWQPSDPQHSIALALHTEDWEVLRAGGVNAVPALTTGAANGDTNRQIQCVKLLSETGTTAAATVVRSLLDDPSNADPDLTRACVVGLGRLRDRNAIPRLGGLAHDQFTGPAALTRLDLLLCCTAALRTIDPAWGQSVNEGYVFMCLHTPPRHESAEMLCAIVDLVGDIPDSRVDEFCVSLLTGKETSVRAQAAVVLRRRGWVPGSREASATIYSAERAYDSVLALGDDAVAPLRAVADSDSIDVLAQIGSDSARHALVDIFREGFQQRYTDVSKAIQEYPHVAFLRPLVGCLTQSGPHTDERNRAAADAMIAVIQHSPVEAPRLLKEIVRSAGVRGRVIAGFACHATSLPSPEECPPQLLGDYAADPSVHSATLSEMVLSAVGESEGLWPQVDPPEPSPLRSDVLAKWCRLASEALTYHTIRRDKYRSDIRLDVGDDATAQLCAEVSTVTTAVLTRVRDLEDAEAHENTGPLGPPFTWVKFDSRKKLARAELLRRGGPVP